LESTRIDKWLWTVRLFKSRSISTEACKSGKVKVDGKNIKPSRDIKVGDIITIQQNPIIKSVKVKQILKNRVSATLAAEAMEDLTSSEEYDKLKLMRELNYERRDHGIGRPTKRDRRDIEKLKDIE
jgi:ribosome-associated heat shock protein Hsp15